MSQEALERIEAELKLVRQLVAERGGLRITPAALSQTEAAQMLSCSPDHIAKMVRNGLLTLRDLDGVKRIPVSQIHALLDGPYEKQKPTITKRPRFDPDAFSAKLRVLRKGR